jgi:hypothetical protein
MNQDQHTSLAHKIKWGLYYLFRTPKGRFETKYVLILLLFLAVSVLILDMVLYLCHIG